VADGRGYIIPVGGAEEKFGDITILRRFASLCGNGCRIAIIPTASELSETGARYEALFHEVSIPQFLLVTRDAAGAVAGPLLERAIGVIYRPQTERLSHYFHARLPRQFDVVLHFDETRAVEPLERVAPPVPEELPETYPAGV